MVRCSLIADFTTRMLLPERSGADMTYYKPPTKEQVTPTMVGFQQQWFNACKGGNLKTDCDFDYAGRMIETLMLGLAAHQAGKELKYDPIAGVVTNDSAANAFLTKEYRKGWVLNG
jgi:hypothetical protein